MRISRRVRDALLVTLLTPLIWVYAESQQVRTYATRGTVPVRILLTNPNLAVVRKSVEDVQVWFKGSASQISKLKRRLMGGILLRLDISKPGEKDLVLRDAIARADDISNLNVNVVKVQPSTMELVIDELVEASADVRFEPEDVRLIEPAVIQPPKVRVTLPQWLLSTLREQGEKLVVGVEPAQPLEELSAGVEHTVPAQIELPPVLAENPHVTVSPRNVQLTFTIRKRQRTIVLPRVPVWMVMLPGGRNRFEVRLDEGSRFLHNVKISGPANLIRKVRSDEIPVIATFRLSREELEKGKTQARVHFHLPPKLTVQSPRSTVSFTIVPAEQ